MKRVLITGAAGFVGRHTLAELSAGSDTSDQIIGIGRGKLSSLPDRVAYRQVDLLEEVALRACIAEFRPTHTLHLAAMASVQQSVEAPTETWQSNITGLINLTDVLLRYAPESTLFFVSSGEVYGRAFLSCNTVDEDVVPIPVGSYARSKWFGEEILRDVILRTGIKLVILRPFNHFGPGQDERFVIPSFAGQIARIEAGLAPPVLEVGNLSAARDFLPIRDVVRAYIRLVANADRIASGTVFNIASGFPRTIESVLSDLRSLARAPFEVRVKSDRMRPSEISVAAGDASRLIAAIDWVPIEDWTQSLVGILSDMRSQIEKT